MTPNGGVLSTGPYLALESDVVFHDHTSKTMYGEALLETFKQGQFTNQLLAYNFNLGGIITNYNVDLGYSKCSKYQHSQHHACHVAIFLLSRLSPSIPVPK